MSHYHGLHSYHSITQARDSTLHCDAGKLAQEVAEFLAAHPKQSRVRLSTEAGLGRSFVSNLLTRPGTSEVLTGSAQRLRAVMRRAEKA